MKLTEILVNQLNVSGFLLPLPQVRKKSFKKYYFWVWGKVLFLFVESFFRFFRAQFVNEVENDDESLLRDENYEDWTVTSGYNESLVLGQNETNCSDGNGSEMWFGDGGNEMMRHSSTITLLLVVAYIIILLIGVVGNSLVVCVVLRSPRMRTVTNLFILNLAVADLLVVLFCLPPTLLSNILVRK